MCKIIKEKKVQKSFEFWVQFYLLLLFWIVMNDDDVTINRLVLEKKKKHRIKIKNLWICRPKRKCGFIFLILRWAKRNSTKKSQNKIRFPFSIAIHLITAVKIFIFRFCCWWFCLWWLLLWLLLLLLLLHWRLHWHCCVFWKHLLVDQRWVLDVVEIYSLKSQSRSIRMWICHWFVVHLWRWRCVAIWTSPFRCGTVKFRTYLKKKEILWTKSKHFFHEILKLNWTERVKHKFNYRNMMIFIYFFMLYTCYMLDGKVSCHYAES